MPIFLFALGLLFGSLWLILRIWRKPRQAYWDGPVPTPGEAAANKQAIIEVLQEFPDSALRHQYPYEWNVAQATRRYEELEGMKERGEIDDIDYERELEKILPLIQL